MNKTSSRTAKGWRRLTARRSNTITNFVKEARGRLRFGSHAWMCCLKSRFRPKEDITEEDIIHWMQVHPSVFGLKKAFKRSASSTKCRRTFKNAKKPILVAEQSEKRESPVLSPASTVGKTDTPSESKISQLIDHQLWNPHLKAASIWPKPQILQFILEYPVPKQYFHITLIIPVPKLIPIFAIPLRHNTAASARNFVVMNNITNHKLELESAPSNLSKETGNESDDSLNSFIKEENLDEKVQLLDTVQQPQDTPELNFDETLDSSSSNLQPSLNKSGFQEEKSTDIMLSINDVDDIENMLYDMASDISLDLRCPQCGFTIC